MVPDRDLYVPSWALMTVFDQPDRIAPAQLQTRSGLLAPGAPIDRRPCLSAYRAAGSEGVGLYCGGACWPRRFLSAALAGDSRLAAAASAAFRSVS